MPSRPTLERVLRIAAVVLPLLAALAGHLASRHAARIDPELASDVLAIQRVESVLSAAQPRDAATPSLEFPGAAVRELGYSGFTRGAHLECRVDFVSVVYPHKLDSATCRAPGWAGWDAALPTYRRYARTLVVRDGQLEAGNVAARSDSSGDRARARVLGPMLEVVVPESLAAQYAALTARDDARCDNHSDAAQALAFAGRFDLLRNALRGPSVVGRFEAATALIRYGPLTREDDAAIDLLPKLTPQLMNCLGCVHTAFDVAASLDSSRRNRPATADLGLRPFVPPRPIRPGLDEATQSIRPGPEGATQRGVESERAVGVGASSVPSVRGRVVLGETSHSGGRVPLVVAGYRAGFRSCYNRGLADSPKAHGAVRLVISVGPDGEVTAVRAQPDPDVPPNVVSCMRARAGASQFDARGAPFEVVVNATLSPEE